MKNVASSAHQFALYYESTTLLKDQQELILTEPLLVHRLINVLRLQANEDFLFFNRTHHARAHIKRSAKKEVVCCVETVHTNKELVPSITVLLPLLKKDALSQALYACTELGATTIQPIITQKSASALKVHEMPHLQKIIIAAAEQSKNFVFPAIQPPMALTDALTTLPLTHTKIFFDPHGDPISKIVPALVPHQELVLMMGPEGDLTPSEKELVKNNGFVFCALTPTVLRAQQALVVGLGALRSWTNQT